MGFGISGACDDLIELGMPENSNERYAGCDWRDEVGTKRGRVEDVEVASFGAGDDVGRVWREADVARRIV